MMSEWILSQSVGMGLLGYLGPGAGVAISFSFLTVLAALVGVAVIVFFSPVSLGMMLLKGRRRRRGRLPFRKVVVVGLDGLDPKIIARLMAEGKAPHFSELAATGCFHPLQTSTPAISPTAWSSFMTGNDASYHNIYDFIVRDPRTYRPKLSSSEIVSERRSFQLGGIRIPLGRPHVRALRKSVPFWVTLGRAGIESTILRVPITFPPEPFRGRVLSGMCVPDLLGTQGTYTYYGTSDGRDIASPGHFVPLTFSGDVAKTLITGPAHPSQNDCGPLTLPLTLRRDREHRTVRLSFAGADISLNAGQSSEWTTVSFPAGLRTVCGLVQFHLMSVTPDVQLYMSPIHIHPEKAVMPISHPALFSDWLGKSMGPFGTLGLMEDTSALNDGALGPQAFMEQVRAFYHERRQMLLHAIDKDADDVIVCVFDTPDRTQHMFWRDRNIEATSSVQGEDMPCASVVEQMYIEMDRLVGDVRDRIGGDTLLMVMSDHGFTDFNRGVNLNTWLHQNGYLALLPGAQLNREWLEGVDWSKTSAYAMGLSGIYINLRGREAQGMVEPGAAYDRLILELKMKLESLTDTSLGGEVLQPIRRVILPTRKFTGPFRHDGPDLIIGYNTGYRCSWPGAAGQVTDTVICENTQVWSGDHCVDPELVPGVLFSNYPFKDETPRIVDIAPTILDLFGVASSTPMQGQSLFGGCVVHNA